MEKKPCTKHPQDYVEFLCFDANCKYNRLLCYKCTFDIHKNHQRTLLFPKPDNRSAKINNLRIYCKESNKEQTINRINSKFRQILEIKENFLTSIDSLKKTIEEHLIETMKTIIAAFDEATPQREAQQLLQNYDIQKAQNLVFKIQKFDLPLFKEDLSYLIKAIDDKNTKISQIFKAESQKIFNSLNIITKTVKNNSIFWEETEENPNQNQNTLEQMNKIINSQRNSENSSYCNCLII